MQTELDLLYFKYIQIAYMKEKLKANFKEEEEVNLVHFE